MIFPIGDDGTDRATTPYVNYVRLALNILVFVFGRPRRAAAFRRC